MDRSADVALGTGWQASSSADFPSDVRDDARSRVLSGLPSDFWDDWNNAMDELRRIQHQGQMRAPRQRSPADLADLRAVRQQIRRSGLPVPDDIDPCLFARFTRLDRFAPGEMHAPRPRPADLGGTSTSRPIWDLERQLKEKVDMLKPEEVVKCVHQLKAAGNLDGWNEMVARAAKSYQAIQAFNLEAFNKLYKTCKSSERSQDDLLALCDQFCRLDIHLQEVNKWEELFKKIHIDSSPCPEAKTQLRAGVDEVKKFHECQQAASEKRGLFDAWFDANQDDLDLLMGQDSYLRLGAYMRTHKPRTNRKGEVVKYQGEIQYERWDPQPWLQALRIADMEQLNERVIELGLGKEAQLLAHGIIPPDGQRNIEEAELVRRLAAYVQKREPSSSGF